MRAIAFILVVGVGCANRAYEECSSGLLCASPKLCAEPSGLCVSEPQIRACEGLADGAACSLQPAQTSLNAVWAASATDAFAIGDAGTFLRYDGSTWSALAEDVTSQLNGLWGTDASNVFAVGDEGSAFRFDGTEWSPVATDATESIEAVMGSGSDVWAVGDAWIGRFDGVRFVREDTGLVVNGTAVFAVEASVFVATDRGTVAQFDGSSWQESATGTTADLAGIWGTSPTNVFAVGSGGTIVHYDGSAWTIMDSTTTLGLEEVHGFGATSVFAVGVMGTLLHYDGAAWTSIPSGTDSNLNSVFVIGTEGFAVGEGGAILEGADVSWQPAVTDGRCLYRVCQSIPRGP